MISPLSFRNCCWVTTLAMVDLLGAIDPVDPVGSVHLLDSVGSVHLLDPVDRVG